MTTNIFNTSGNFDTSAGVTKITVEICCGVSKRCNTSKTSSNATVFAGGGDAYSSENISFSTF